MRLGTEVKGGDSDSILFRLITCTDHNYMAKSWLASNKKTQVKPRNQVLVCLSGALLGNKRSLHVFNPNFSLKQRMGKDFKISKIIPPLR